MTEEELPDTAPSRSEEKKVRDDDASSKRNQELRLAPSVTTTDSNGTVRAAEIERRGRSSMLRLAPAAATDDSHVGAVRVGTLNNPDVKGPASRAADHERRPRRNRNNNGNDADASRKEQIKAEHRAQVMQNIADQDNVQTSGNEANGDTMDAANVSSVPIPPPPSLNNEKPRHTRPANKGPASGAAGPAKVGAIAVHPSELVGLSEDDDKPRSAKEAIPMNHAMRQVDEEPMEQEHPQANDDNVENDNSTLVEAEVAPDMDDMIESEVFRRMESQRQKITVAVEADHVDESGNGCNKKLGIAAIVALLAAAIGIGVSQALSRQAPSPTPEPTPSDPSPAPTAVRAVVEGILAPYQPLHEQALNWLTEISTWKPETGDPNANYLWLERYALASLYFSTNGTSWTGQNFWLSSEPVCNWYFASPNNCTGGPLLSIDLEENGLQGTIPSVLFELTALTYFRLGPSAYFSLDNNPLTGTIPASIGYLTSLTRLYLYRTELTGTIPSSIGDLTNLERLFLYRNQLTGTIPSSIGNLTSLTGLSLYKNRLTGSIPVLPTTLDSWGCRIYDNCFSNLTNAETDGRCDVSTNCAPTASPSAVPTLAPTLSPTPLRPRLESILAPYGPLDEQTMVWLTKTSTWEPDAGEPNADYLWLERYAMALLFYSTNGPNWKVDTNWLSSEPVCNWFLGVATTCDGPITSVYLTSNRLQGTIPPVFFELTAITNLRLWENKLTGTIPSSIGDVHNITELYLHGNQLTGTIPASIGNLSSLAIMGLYGNQLSGAIPSSIGNLSSLKYLDLNGNQLTGTIPSSIGNLSSLEVLYLSNNNLNGSVPVLPSTLVGCGFQKNCFSDLSNAEDKCVVSPNCA